MWKILLSTGGWQHGTPALSSWSARQCQPHHSFTKLVSILVTDSYHIKMWWKNMFIMFSTLSTIITTIIKLWWLVFSTEKRFRLKCLLTKICIICLTNPNWFTNISKVLSILMLTKEVVVEVSIVTTSLSRTATSLNTMQVIRQK